LHHRNRSAPQWRRLLLARVVLRRGRRGIAMFRLAKPQPKSDRSGLRTDFRSGSIADY
jgi:hypothetical protein